MPVVQDIAIKSYRRRCVQAVFGVLWLFMSAIAISRLWDVDTSELRDVFVYRFGLRGTDLCIYLEARAWCICWR